MARGRAPCCDKNNVNRGPWSPAEDLKLITFIEKHGHDNWRSLPRQAGLRRCGKSCRLRWVNYLCPDVKRGNFSQEEEGIIIRLHQAMGNKWSKIASHLPGRTDNEIKNVWNTHLKKRLARKAVEDATKETSVITSSSSSSATAESKFKRQKSEIESQMKLLAHEENKKKTAGTGFTEMTLTPSPQTTVVNQVTKVNHTEPSNSVSDNKQLDQFTIWEDPSLLESVLNEVDDLNWPAPENTQNGFTENNSSCVLLTEADFHFDFDFWSMLDDDVMPAPAKADQKEAYNPHIVEAPMTKKSNVLYGYIDDKDINNMFEYPEKEAGLAQQSVGVFEKQKQHQKNDINNSFSEAATCSEVPGIPNMNGYPMWPPSPIYFFEPRTSQPLCIGVMPS